MYYLHNEPNAVVLLHRRVLGAPNIGDTSADMVDLHWELQHERRALGQVRRSCTLVQHRPRLDVSGKLSPEPDD